MTNTATKALDTDTTLRAVFNGRSIRTRNQMIAICHAVANKWDRRSASFARSGMFQEADDAADETTSIGHLIEEIEQGDWDRRRQM